jgi:AraC family transcriptional regulator
MTPSHFHGTVAYASVFGRVRISEFVFAPRVRLARHGHSSAYLSFVIDGSYTETVGAREMSCTPNVLLYHPPGEEHADIFGMRGGRCLNIELSGDLLANGDRTMPARPVWVDSAAWPAMRLRRLLYEADTECTVDAEEITLALLDRCHGEAARRARIRDSAPVRRAMEFIDAHLTEALTLRAIAEAAGVHETHLARVFRQRTGITAGEYARRRRIAHAERALRTERTSASAIAIRLGFADLAHFSRTFRRVVGVSPTEFRRKCNNGLGASVVQAHGCAGPHRFA